MFFARIRRRSTDQQVGRGRRKFDVLGSRHGVWLIGSSGAPKRHCVCRVRTYRQVKTRSSRLPGRDSHRLSSSCCNMAAEMSSTIKIPCVLCVASVFDLFCVGDCCLVSTVSTHCWRLAQTTTSRLCRCCWTMEPTQSSRGMYAFHFSFPPCVASETRFLPCCLPKNPVWLRILLCFLIVRIAEKQHSSLQLRMVTGRLWKLSCDTNVPVK